ncbi:MAG: Crp/Fnr family transcriptional regulator [Clostridia bacterium]|nr:Crp/Fnr family transcriptional regulator [Clostridia bacterium]
MEDFIEVFQSCILFDGIDPKDIRAMLGCLRGRVVTFDRGEAIFRAESRAEDVGIVLEGAAQVVRDDFFGNRTIQARIEPGELFAEAFACAAVERLPVTVEGVRPGKAMVIRLRRIIETCSSACEFHNRMVMNLLKAVAARNLQLNRKLEITSQRTTRDKLLAYLTAQARQAKSMSFTIPFDRQGLADYLCVERSALSAEIGKLRREGVLESERSKFILNDVNGGR